MIKEISVPGYHKVIEGIDKERGLHCFIAIHDLTLGHALGGIRMYPYLNEEDALTDVLRLAKGMTLKAAAAEVALGGGKSVIIGDSKTQKKEPLLLAFAEVVNSLKGNYIAAEDVGINCNDLLVIHKKTDYVAALPTRKSSGDPSRFTAWGVFKGIQAVAQQLWGTTSIKGKRILVQGLGQVGSKLAKILFWEGAELIFCDPNTTEVAKLALEYGAKVVDLQSVYEQECDIFSPCAMGAGINEKTIAQFRCAAIAGSANNQLAKPEDAVTLMQRGILYAPDFIINSGGIINAATEFDAEGYNPIIARNRVEKIYDRLLRIFTTAEKENLSPAEVANRMAQDYLQQAKK